MEENSFGSIKKGNGNGFSRFVFSALIVLGVFLVGSVAGYFFALSDGFVKLEENQRIYFYSFSDENGHSFLFNENYCIEARDGDAFCFNGFSMNDFKINFSVLEVEE